MRKLYWEHWTYQYAKEYASQGYRYAIFDRRSKGDGYHQGINSLREMYQFLDKAYPGMDSYNNQVRIALLPQYENDNIFSIMYYSEDGTFRKKGTLIVNYFEPTLEV